MRWGGKWDSKISSLYREELKRRFGEKLIAKALEQEKLSASYAASVRYRDRNALRYPVFETQV